MSGGYELVSLVSEYSKHLSSVVLNSYNYLPISNSSFLLFFNFIFNIDFRCYFIYPVHCIDSSISEISKICDSESKCTCTCVCEPQCKGNFICLCLCNGTKTEATKCCICICKKQEQNGNCKCVCICICNKDCSTKHECKKCLSKINLSTLQSQISQIIILLYCIVCCISRIENQSGSNTECCCICCPNGCKKESCPSNCCSKDGKIDYLSIISRIKSIELLFKEVGTKIADLRTLKNILSIISLILTKCPKCPEQCCNDKIDSLIKNIDRSLHYYYLFGSRLDDIRSYVEYKLNYWKSKQIIYSLEKSVNPMSKQLQLINSQILRNADYARTSDQLLVLVYSYYKILECYLIVSNLSIYSSKGSNKIYNIIWFDRCDCVRKFESMNTNNGLEKGDLEKYLIYCCNKSLDDLNKLIMNKDRNHLCLCIMMKYVLYPSLIKSLYCARQIYLDSLSKLKREFIPPMFMGIHVNDVINVIFFVIDVLYKISFIIDLKLFSFITMCFCGNWNDIYYSYLISIILFVSSLVENIWTMDPETIRVSIERLSVLYAQLEIYDLNSTSLKRVCCSPVYSLLVNKECKAEATKKCCCCFCLTCYNLGIILIFLCLQFKLFIGMGGKKGCEDWKKWFELGDCQCTDKENGMCCLLKLALSELPCSNKDLEKALADCCKACNAGQNCCCKTLLDKVKGGLCKVLLLGCGCACTEKKVEGEFKGKIVSFKNPYSDKSVAVVVFCKCPKPDDSGCCLTSLIQKIKDNVSNKICEDSQCVCDDLKNVCKDLCCPKGCDAECPPGCVCKTLKAEIQKICNGDSGKCLCKKIKDVIDNLCKTGCPCKTGNTRCKCPCCKVLRESVRILVRACRANVLGPYKRITMDLLSSSKDKKQIMKSIVKGINQTRLNNIYLLKNNLLTSTSYPDSKIGLKDISSVRNWGYDTRYEHKVTSDRGIRKSDIYPLVFMFINIRLIIVIT